ncbi:NDR1/HIN1-like protein [Dyadobacter sandarakinus]|uniref:LEA type 2 family protein n=1 Tax=Dyadobacter sandarakinus TaxID=2747268 RepID=A0ABX7I614_9BACT|nr:LEA type 2 family protein [Dyadobacter sandarakinus]QRR00618.1 LEA type 2 family protein [Dyadobacter sandarakinus]
MKNRKWLIILLVLLAAAAVLWLWWRGQHPGPVKQEVTEALTPDLSLANLSITDIDDDRIKLTSKVTVHNRLPMQLSAKQVDYQIYIDSVKIIEDVYQKPLVLKSGDSTTLTIPMQVLKHNLVGLLKHFDKAKTDSADYGLRASFETDVPVAGEKLIKLHLTKKLPAIRIPKIDIKDVDIHAFDLKNKGVDVTLQLFNPNQFAIKMRDAAFHFAMEDALQMEGVLQPATISLEPRSSRTIKVHCEVKERKFLKAGWELLTNKKDTHFNTVFKALVLSDNEMLNNSNIRTTVKGTMDELLHVAE